MDDDGLVEKAREAMERAYAPYSGFRVGAALLAEDGSVHTGCNVENVSYGLTICAERAAVAGAVVRGMRKYQAVAIVTEAEGAVAPCGACRQVLTEFSPGMTIVSEGRGGRRAWRLHELIPDAFDELSGVRGRKDEIRS